MGVVNTTPDSFSDGGRFLAPDAAFAHGLELLTAGADLLDVGGESTRPGALPVSAEEEIARVVPVVRRLAAAGAVVSVDTSKADVARAALAAGARMVNDVTALGDPAMADVVASAGAGLILMHMRGMPATMQLAPPPSEDIVADVLAYLADRLEVAERAGIARGAVALDPGIGFGKTTAQNVAILAGLPRLRALDRPLVLGVSRKSVLGALTGRPVDGREAATTAAHAVGIFLGADIIRAHDVAAALDAARVAGAIASAGGAP